jgi:hypothetical protein
VKGILADVNIQGHVDDLVVIMRSDSWKIFWDDLRLEYFVFADVGLSPDSPDSLIWDTCQREELVLLTNNRNEDDADSLQATINARNSPMCLPVFTIANIPHLRKSRPYAERVIDKIFDYLMRIESLRGTGRLYVP